MTTSLDPAPPSPSSPSSPSATAHPSWQPPTPPTARPRRRRSAGHIIAIVIGCFMLLPGFGLVTGGGAIALAQAVATDDDGYFHVTLDRVESDGVAIATTDLWLDDVEGDASPWVLDWLDVDLRLRVDGARTTDEVFVGIARARDVEDYLVGATYSEVVELDERTPGYREVAGTRRIDSPLEQDFWIASTAGPGEQELRWDARGGRWSVVVMNADGSPIVAGDVEIGVRSGAVTPIAIALLVSGGVVSVIAIALIAIGARGRRSTDEAPPARPSTTTLPPPLPATALRPDDQERDGTPVG